MRKVLAAMIATLGLAVLALTPAPSQSALALTSAPSQSALQWLTSSYGPIKMYQDGATIKWHSTWAIMNQGACNKVPPGAVPAYWFASYKTFSHAVSDGEIAGLTRGRNGCTEKYKAVVVDYENWSATPAYEQHHWRYYVKKASHLAHAHGLTVIQAICGACLVGGWSNWLREDGPGYVAAHSDVFDIQAQSYETNLSGHPGSYNYDVIHSSQLATKANPAVKVITGLHTQSGGCNGTHLTQQQTIDAWDSVADHVSGAWFNADCHPRSLVRLTFHIQNA